MDAGPARALARPAAQGGCRACQADGHQAARPCLCQPHPPGRHACSGRADGAKPAAPATPVEQWLATGGRTAAGDGTAPLTEERIPYNSLMEALGRATGPADRSGKGRAAGAAHAARKGGEEAPVAQSCRRFGGGADRRLVGLRAVEPRRKRRGRRSSGASRAGGRRGWRSGEHPLANAQAGGARGQQSAAHGAPGSAAN